MCLLGMSYIKECTLKNCITLTQFISQTALDLLQDGFLTSLWVICQSQVCLRCKKGNQSLKLISDCPLTDIPSNIYKRLSFLDTEDKSPPLSFHIEDSSIH